MSAQVLTIALQIAAACIWLWTLACVSSANEMSKQSVTRDGVAGFGALPGRAQPHINDARTPNLPINVTSTFRADGS